LAGVLNGAAFGRDVVDFTVVGSEPTNTGQFVIALDVARFISPELFAAEMDRHLAELRSSPTLPGFDAIRLPGEERRKRRADRTANGVQLPAALLKQLDELAASLGITSLAGRIGQR
jgi:LDH2 family malate/lactate/ureidoglycolate dehydrogenase